MEGGEEFPREESVLVICCALYTEQCLPELMGMNAWVHAFTISMNSVWRMLHHLWLYIYAP